jgi:hypothetical protein
MSVANPPEATASPRVLSPFVRRILEFGVWVAVGMAPFLGYAKVRGFTAVIEMYPAALQHWLIPLSGLFMGMIAVVVDFAKERKIAQRVLTRWFVRTVATFLVSLIVMIALYLLTVTTFEQSVRLPDGGIDHGTNAVVTGRTTVPPVVSKSCGCEPAEDAEQCITAMSLESKNVKACFGGTAIAFASLGLALVYLVLTGSFAAAVGLGMLAQRRRRTRQ